MIDYLYDGTFDGLLTCVYYHYYNDKCYGIFSKNDYSPNLISVPIFIDTDFEKSKKVYDSLQLKVSKTFLKNIYYLFLSNFEDKGKLILAYTVLGFKIGNSIDSYHSNSIVNAAQKQSRKVSLEVQRFLGLIRFSDVSNSLYSSIEPDNDILELLASHFMDRFSSEKIIIHDTKRKKALIAHDYKWHITDFSLKKDINFSDTEIFFRELWKDYHFNVGIEERKNPKLQSQYMPRRYWKNLTEFE